MCGIALKAVGNASPPSTVSYLTPSLVFLGSWLGHSNVVSFEFKSTDLPSPRERAPSPPSPASTTAAQPLDAAAATTPLPSFTVEPSTDGASSPAAVVDTAPGMAAAAAAAEQDAVLAGAADDTEETGGAGLDSLLSQMQGLQDSAAGASDAVKREREPDDAPSGGAVEDAAEAPAVKAARVEPPGLGAEAAATAPFVPPPPEPESPRHGMLPGLPFAGLVNSAVPGLPGLGLAGGTPLGAATSSQVLTEVPEAPLGEGSAPSSDDDSDLEAALYQFAPALCPALCRATDGTGCARWEARVVACHPGASACAPDTAAHSLPLTGALASSCRTDSGRVRPMHWCELLLWPGPTPS